MIWISLVLPLACTLVVEIAHARETRYKDYLLETRDGERIVVQVLRGQVRLVPSATKILTIKVRKTVGDRASAEDQSEFDALSFAVRRDGQGTLVIEAKGPESKAAVGQWLKPGSPELIFEIEAPLLPIEVMLREGVFSAQSWKQALAVNVVSGGVRTSQTEGAFKLQIQRGEVKIEGHRGRIELDSYGAKLSVQDLEGDLDLTNFAGESSVALAKGNIDLRGNSGALSVVKSSGSVDFESVRGAVSLQGFEGPVKGQVDQASVSLGLEGEAEVQIESNQGPVTVKLPATSGAAVRIQSDEGTLVAPEPVAKAGAARIKVVSGVLSGSGPKGNVSVKSKLGNIRVKI